MECPLYRGERCVLLSQVTNNNPIFSTLSIHEKFVYLLARKDVHILTRLGKFLYLIFKKQTKNETHIFCKRREVTLETVLKYCMLYCFMPYTTIGTVCVCMYGI